MSSSKDDRERQPALNKGTHAPREKVKPNLTEQRVEASTARDEGKSNAGLWEQIWERENLTTAMKRVESNQGAPGIDGMTVKEMKPYLKAHWLEIREALDQQTYRPSAVYGSGAGCDSYYGNVGNEAELVIVNWWRWVYRGNGLRSGQWVRTPGI